MHNPHVPHVTEQTREAGETIVDEINRLEDELKRIQLAICSSKTRLGALYNAENPFIQFPTEILSRIMEESLDPSERVEITISHVCRRLRQIALSTSSLWTKIIAPGWSESMMEAYMTRSGRYPLDIDLAVEVPAEYGGNLQYVDHAIALLSRDVLRWQSLELSYDDFRISPLLPDHGSAHPLPFLQYIDSVPNLRSLTLYISRSVQHHQEFVPDARQMLFRQGAPNLTKLDFWTENFSLLWLLPPLDNVVSLTIGSMDQRNSRFAGGIEQTPIPILQLLSHRKLRQFALEEEVNQFNFRPIQLDLTIPPHLSALRIEYNHLSSLRIPLKVIPSLLTFPRQIFEEITHLFVDIMGTGDSFLEDFGRVDNSLTIDLLPKLGYFTLYVPFMDFQTFDRVEAKMGFFLNLTKTITHFFLIGQDESAVGNWYLNPSPDYWPMLEVVYLDQPSMDSFLASLTLQCAVQRKGLQPSFVIEVPRTRHYLEHLTKFEDVREVLQDALAIGALREVEGPSFPAADIEWLPVCSVDDEDTV